MEFIKYYDDDEPSIVKNVLPTAVKEINEDEKNMRLLVGSDNYLIINSEITSLKNTQTDTKKRLRSEVEKKYNKEYKIVKRAIDKADYSKHPDLVVVKKSQFRAKDSLTKTYTKDIGFGLFAKVDIPKKTFIEPYIGTIMNAEVYKKEVNEGYGGYAIVLNKSSVYQCFKNIHCRASYANDSRRLKHKNTNTKPKLNARIVVNNRHTKDMNRLVSIHSIRDIKANEEIFVHYGKGYFNKC
jgi:putative transposon-encoded protein